MAQNFINLFETDSLYNAAKSGLSQPNVSLVKESGNLHYTKAIYGLAASEFGDIILEDSTKLYSISPDDYNLTDFPLETYTPIGVNVYPGSQANDGLSRVLSIRFMDYKTPDIGNYSGSNTPNWGGNKVRDSYSDVTSDTLLNGKENTTYIISHLQSVDWSGTQLNNTASTTNYPAFCACSRFHTNVTQAGDWYFGSIAEYNYIAQNYNLFTEINDLLKNLLNINNNILTGIVLKSSTETGVDGSFQRIVQYNGSLSSIGKNSSGSIKAMLQIGVEEV